jgi:iron complex outermembrane receptor protein
MVFASITKGYQSGGFDALNPYARFAPERVWNVEIGLKSVWPHSGASLDASLFHYRFTNLQNITLVANNGALPVYDLTTSDRIATGIDIDARLPLNRRLMIFGSSELMHQRYANYVYSAPLSGATIHLNGEPVGTPWLTLALGVRAEWALWSGKAEWLLQGTYRSALRCNLQLRAEFACLDTGVVRTGQAQTKLDLRAGWASGDSRFSVALIVNNLLNSRHVTTANGGGESAFTLGAPYATVSVPRQVSVEVRASL